MFKAYEGWFKLSGSFCAKNEAPNRRTEVEGLASIRLSGICAELPATGAKFSANGVVLWAFPPRTHFHLV